MTQYILSEDADRDLDGIWDYIAEDNVEAADQWIGRLFDAFDAIGNTPGIGHKREDLTTYRFFSGRWAPTWSSIAPHPSPLRLWPSPKARAIFPPSCTIASPRDSVCNLQRDCGPNIQK